MSAQTPTAGQQTLDGGFRDEPDETIVDVSDESSNEPLLLLLECPFCDVQWRDAYHRGEHSLHAIEEHILIAHARSVDHARDDEHHSFSRGGE